MNNPQPLWAKPLASKAPPQIRRPGRGQPLTLEPSSGQEPGQHHHPVPELPNSPAPSSPTVLLKPRMPLPPQTTGPALHDPLTRHQAFLGPPERRACVAKLGLPGGQPTGWGPSSQCILMPLVLMQSGAGPPVSSWKQAQEMQGLCPPDCSAVFFQPI